ncbi:CLUMA_CG015967, isoform A [Clunio marinus]|uniref:CLUMA_CG015967, isoform A n=1 Tax=Clunio marinus TaxID=568069 RepID=A0A1J1IUV8_9DIPT|nr:CLUMA_CG015967, isoform A [Clunio marinus]
MENNCDETLWERICAMSEIIPTFLRNPMRCLGKFLWSSYQFTCEASYLLFVMSVITLGPVVYETEQERQLEKSFQESQTKIDK